MIDLLTEGLDAARLPCSLMVILPGIAVLLAAQERLALTTAAYALAVSVVAWLRFAGFTSGWPLLAAAGALVMAAVVLVFTRIDTGNIAAWLGGGLAGGAAALLWQPLVGRELGRVILDLRGEGIGGAFGLAAYLLAMLVPVIVVGLVLRLVPRGWREKRWQAQALVGGGVLVALALIAATGVNDEVATRLIQWSL
jgi:hypothetical protein